MFTGIFIIPFLGFSQVKDTLILGDDFIVSNKTASTNPSKIATTTSLNNTITTLTNADKALSGRIDSCSNAVKGLQTQINNLPLSGGGTYYKYKNVSSVSYTITEADSSTVIFFTSTLSTTTVSVRALTKPIAVKLVSVAKPVLVSPNTSITISSVASYKRISSGGAADLLFNSTSTANLCGQITK